MNTLSHLLFLVLVHQRDSPCVYWIQPNSTDYQEFDKINKQFMEELEKRPELTGVFTFFAANYPQYELEIDNKLAMQKGVSIGEAMENLNIMIGSTFRTRVHQVW